MTLLSLQCPRLAPYIAVVILLSFKPCGRLWRSPSHHRCLICSAKLLAFGREMGRGEQKRREEIEAEKKEWQ